MDKIEKELIGDQEKIIEKMEIRWKENYAELIRMSKEQARKEIEAEKRKILCKEKGSKAKTGNKKKEKEELKQKRREEMEKERK